MVEKEDLLNRKLTVIANIGIKIMRNESDPLWKEFATELRAIDKRLVELGVNKVDVSDYEEEIPEWIV